MNIKRHKKFKKNYKKLSLKLQSKIDNSLRLFINNPFDTRLHNHSLKGEYLGCRSLNAGGDLRLIFREKNNYIEILFLDVGTHSKLY